MVFFFHFHQLFFIKGLHSTSVSSSSCTVHEALQPLATDFSITLESTLDGFLLPLPQAFLSEFYTHSTSVFSISCTVHEADFSVTLGSALDGFLLAPSIFPLPPPFLTSLLHIIFDICGTICRVSSFPSFYQIGFLSYIICFVHI